MSYSPNSEAREIALKFLYQCESERLYYFSEGHFQKFVQHFEVPQRARQFARHLVEGVLDQRAHLDEVIAGASSNWSIARMSVIDRSILRMAVFELGEKEAPFRVIINEAIELAKKFGSETSRAFINGLLDKIARPTQGGS